MLVVAVLESGGDRGERDLGAVGVGVGRLRGR